MNLASASARLRKFEGAIPWMYRDGTGVVTAGVGHALFSPEAAVQLPWRDLDGCDAAPALIRNDWGIVKSAPPNMPASRYEAYTTCRLDGASITAVLQADAQRFAERLAARLPAWAAWPELAQEALFDMAYNLGVEGLLKYEAMLAAALAGDWQSAARESHRRGVSEARNAEIAALLRECKRSEGATEE